MATKKNSAKETPAPSTDGFMDWVIHQLAVERGWTDSFTKDWAEQKWEQSRKE